MALPTLGQTLLQVERRASQRGDGLQKALIHPGSLACLSSKQIVCHSIKHFFNQCIAKRMNHIKAESTRRAHSQSSILVQKKCVFLSVANATKGQSWTSLESAYKKIEKNSWQKHENVYTQIVPAGGLVHPSPDASRLHRAKP
ncbi:hypothetical protein RN347_06050 [Halomonas sp. PAMB 3264]|uniref:hypothetical protein n=1 Tax=Halomonas sp. PAMB 3264 TaxID=3075222 RepID=UPI00289D140B|nr:hypothetical protein [Halomonas sp. PAMB 3264]WNL43464.1 hypothetical protein RN347_06050 [Halomonas sp. PAMB 3264]